MIFIVVDDLRHNEDIPTADITVNDVPVSDGEIVSCMEVSVSQHGYQSNQKRDVPVIQSKITDTN